MLATIAFLPPLLLQAVWLVIMHNRPCCQDIRLHVTWQWWVYLAVVLTLYLHDISFSWHHSIFCIFHVVYFTCIQTLHVQAQSVKKWSGQNPTSPTACYGHAVNVWCGRYNWVCKSQDIRYSIESCGQAMFTKRYSTFDLLRYGELPGDGPHAAVRAARARTAMY